MKDLGAVAMTGTELVSNAVSAFKPTGGGEHPDRHRALSVDLVHEAVEMATTARCIATIRIEKPVESASSSRAVAQLLTEQLDSSFLNVGPHAES
jgi:hypothetical protein